MSLIARSCLNQKWELISSDHQHLAPPHLPTHHSPQSPWPSNPPPLLHHHLLCPLLRFLSSSAAFIVPLSIAAPIAAPAEQRAVSGPRRVPSSKVTEVAGAVPSPPFFFPSPSRTRKRSCSTAPLLDAAMMWSVLMMTERGAQFWMSFYYFFL